MQHLYSERCGSRKLDIKDLSWRVQDLVYVSMLRDGSTCLKGGQVMRFQHYGCNISVRRLRKSVFRSHCVHGYCYFQDEIFLQGISNPFWPNEGLSAAAVSLQFYFLVGIACKQGSSNEKMIHKEGTT